MKTAKILMLAIILLIAAPIFSSAISDFTAGSERREISLCQCDAITDTITVKNTGGIGYQTVYEITDGQETIKYIPVYKDSAFAITQEGTGAKYSTIAPKAFSLKYGQSQQLTSFIRAPCDRTGRYSLKTTIKADETEKELEQEIVVNFCPNIELSLKKAEGAKCPCTTFSYELEVKNTGKFAEEYSVAAEKFASYLAASSSSFILGPGEAKKVYMYFTPECGLYGAQEIPVSVTAKSTGQRATLMLKAEIGQCYDYNITFGEAYEPAKNVTKVEFKEAAAPYEFCEIGQAAIPAIIKNTAQIGNNYSLSLNGPKFGNLDYKKISIKPGEKAAFNIMLAPYPNKPGDYIFYLTTETELGGIAKTSAVPVRLKNCYMPEINPENLIIRVNYTESLTPITIRNSGEKKATYGLNITGPEWISIGQDRLILDANQTAGITIRTKPTNTTGKGTYGATIIALEANTRQYSRKIVISLRQPGPIAKAFGIVIDNILWVIAGLVIAIILVSVIMKVAKRTPSAKEQRLIKEFVGKKKAEKKREMPGWLVAMVVAAAVIAIGVLSYAFVVKPLTGLNVTANITAKPAVPAVKPALNVTAFNETFVGRAAYAAKGLVANYLWYLVAGLAIVAAVIIAHEVIRRRGKKPEKEEAKEEEKPEKKRIEKKIEKKAEKKPKKKKRNYKTLAITILVIIALAAIGMTSYFWGIPFIGQNITNVTKAAEAPKPEIKVNVTAFNETLVGKAVYSAGGFIKDYALYIIAGMAVLAALIIAISIKEKKGKKEKEEPEEIKEAPTTPRLIEPEAKKKREKRKMPWKVILAVIIVAAIVAAAYYSPRLIALIPSMNLTKNITAAKPVAKDYNQILQNALDAIEGGRYRNKNMTVTDTRENREVPKGELSAILVENEDKILGEGIERKDLYEAIARVVKAAQLEKPKEAVNCTFELEQDKEFRINLSEMFRDPDLDVLSYEATEMENMTLMITGETATLVPDKGFRGVSRIIFTADDGKGGVVSSPELTLCVGEPKKQGIITTAYNAIKYYLGGYGSYIVMGVVALIVIIFFIEYKGKIARAVKGKKRK